MKPLLKQLYGIVLFFLIFTACNSEAKKNTTLPTKNKEVKVTKPKIDTLLLGNYVSASYVDRKKGYDWVSVAVRKGQENQIQISVRSRADKKKPTCTFDAIATKRNDTVYESFINEATITYLFTQNSVAIHTENEKDLGVLYYFCSGGASLRDTYQKLNERLDLKQIDSTRFSVSKILQE